MISRLGQIVRRLLNNFADGLSTAQNCTCLKPSAGRLLERANAACSELSESLAAMTSTAFVRPLTVKTLAEAVPPLLRSKQHTQQTYSIGSRI